MVTINHVALTIKNNHHKCITKFQINISISGGKMGFNKSAFISGDKIFEVCLSFAMCMRMKKIIIIIYLFTDST